MNATTKNRKKQCTPWMKQFRTFFASEGRSFCAFEVRRMFDVPDEAQAIRFVRVECETRHSVRLSLRGSCRYGPTCCRVLWLDNEPFQLSTSWLKSVLGWPLPRVMHVECEWR